jgi:large repetitive protein
VTPMKLRVPNRPATLVSVALFLLVGTTGALAVAAGSSAEGQLSCGDTITTDTTLDRDLRGCPNTGIVIGADGVTLDLNGHTVDGDGRPAECRRGQVCDLGVFNEGHDGVTVRDGSVRGFFTGVLVGGARHNRIVNVSSSGNAYFGFVIADSARSEIVGSSGSGNPAPEGDGIGVFFSRRVRIVRNTFRRNALGMHVDNSTGLLIERNRFAGNTDFGILIEADRNVVRGNRTARNGTGVAVAPGSRNVIAGNRSIRDWEGITVEKGRGNLVAGNVIAAARRSGIRLGIVKPAIGGVGTVVRRNVVRGSGRNGFEINPRDRGSRLSGNMALGAGDDGIDVNSHSSTLTNNRANGNADLGIEATRGVVDGGGNSARGNRDARQCMHIRCR